MTRQTPREDDPIDKYEALWRKVEHDRDGKRALAILRRDGFQLKFSPAIFATIPFLPDDRAKSRAITPPKAAVRTVIRFLRDLSKPGSGLDFSEPRTGKVYSPGWLHGLPEFDSLAESLEYIVSRRWVAREFNARTRTIAGLQREIRKTTKAPHYQETLDLLEVIFRVAGKRFDMQDSSLRKLASRDDATLKTAHKKLGPNSPKNR